MHTLPVLFALICSLCLLAAVADAEKPARPIEAALKPFIDSGAVAGAVTLVADKDHVLDVTTIGFADVAAHRPMKVDSVFWIASQSKPITAAAFMMLVDEGRISLDDPVEKYLPEYGGQWLAVEQDDHHVLLRHPAHPITVREILSHSAGLPFSSAMENPTLDGLPLRTAVKSYAMSPLQYEPSTRYQYSNAGINTAGRIIEVVSGMSYEEFLEKRLLGPLGMKETTFHPTKAQIARLAHCYKPNASGDGLEETKIGQLTYPLDGPGRYPMPAGGLFSTASDCARFCRMLLNRGVFEGKRLLSEHAVAEMTRKQTADAVPDSYGLGLSVGQGWFGHGGACNTNMSVDVNRGIVRVYLVQHTAFLKNGGEAQGAFNAAVDAHFGPNAAK